MSYHMSFKDVLKQYEDGPSEIPLPFSDPLGDDTVEAERLIAVHGIERVGNLDRILTGTRWDAFAETPDRLRHTLDYKPDGPEIAEAFFDFTEAAARFIAFDTHCFPGSVKLPIADAFGAQTAVVIVQMAAYLSSLSAVRSTSLDLTDPWLLDVIVDPYIRYFRDQRPDADLESGKKFVLDCLEERWPAPEPSVVATTKRVWNRLQREFDRQASLGAHNGEE